MLFKTNHNHTCKQRLIRLVFYKSSCVKYDVKRLCLKAKNWPQMCLIIDRFSKDDFHRLDIRKACLYFLRNYLEKLFKQKASNSKLQRPYNVFIYGLIVNHGSIDLTWQYSDLQQRKEAHDKRCDDRYEERSRQRSMAYKEEHSNDIVACEYTDHISKDAKPDFDAICKNYTDIEAFTVKYYKDTDFPQMLEDEINLYFQEYLYDPRIHDMQEYFYTLYSYSTLLQGILLKHDKEDRKPKP